MSKKYRKNVRKTAEVSLPEYVNVSMAEVAQDMREGLLALAVGTGLQVMQAVMAEDVAALCGPAGKHDLDRVAVRHGQEDGSVALGGRRVQVKRPRVRSADGSVELPVPSYEVFKGSEVMSLMAMERMLVGLSTRNYRVGLEPVGAKVEREASGKSRSAVSRRFVKLTKTALDDLMKADLSELDLVALMIDGVHYAETCCIVAMGIGIDGTKHPIALVEGSTENATLATELIVGLRDRGLNMTRPILAVLDGSKALRRAVLDVFDHAVIHRCQIHKIRNVTDKLPQHMKATIESKMRAAYRSDSALAAEAALDTLARELDKTHPGAAGSLREGLGETLTVLRLDVPPLLAKTLYSTNPIESMISICRTTASNVKRWRDEDMAVRWCAAGMIEASKKFKRVNGHLHLPVLRAALQAEVADTTDAIRQNEESNAA